MRSETVGRLMVWSWVGEGASLVKLAREKKESSCEGLESKIYLHTFFTLVSCVTYNHMPFCKTFSLSNVNKKLTPRPTQISQHFTSEIK